MNYGLIKEPITPEQHIFGSAAEFPILQPNGQWDDFLPTYEPQFEPGFDTDGCSVWGTQNALEILLYRLTGLKPNYSERYTYILTPVRPPGQNPHVVAESIRKYGLIDQDDLPMAETFADFIQPDPMLTQWLLKGRDWVQTYQMTHEWVWGDTPISLEEKKVLIMEALKYSPVSVSVTAWNEQDGIFVDLNLPNNHWCVCYGYNDLGWKIFDSYDQTEKIYSFSSNIEMSKKYNIVVGAPTIGAEDTKIGFWDIIKIAYEDITGFIQAIKNLI